MTAGNLFSWANPRRVQKYFHRLRQRWTLPRHLVLTFLMLVVCIAFGAVFFYRHFVSITKN